MEKKTINLPIKGGFELTLIGFIILRMLNRKEHILNLFGKDHYTGLTAVMISECLQKICTEVEVNLTKNVLDTEKVLTELRRLQQSMIIETAMENDDEVFFLTNLAEKRVSIEKKITMTIIDLF